MLTSTSEELKEELWCLSSVSPITSAPEEAWEIQIQRLRGKKLDSEERIELRRRIFVTFIWLLVWFGLFRGMTARSSSASWELWWMEMEWCGKTSVTADLIRGTLFLRPFFSFPFHFFFLLSSSAVFWRLRLRNTHRRIRSLAFALSFSLFHPPLLHKLRRNNLIFIFLRLNYEFNFYSLKKSNLQELEFSLYSSGKS